MKQYVWYSPELDRIEVWSMEDAERLNHVYGEYFLKRVILHDNYFLDVRLYYMGEL